MKTVFDHTYITLAERYYQAILKKEFAEVADCLADNVCLISPLAQIEGKEAVLAAAKGLSTILLDIHFRAQFSGDQQIMFAYDFIFAEPIGLLRSAVLMKFVDQKIAHIELFYDSKPFTEKKSEIFK